MEADSHSMTQIELLKCVGNTIKIHCSVSGTLLAWTSEEYIGSGGNDLEFGRFNTPGFHIYSQEFNTTFAVLLSTNNTIESELTVMISSNGNISCRGDQNTVLNVSIVASK